MIRDREDAREVANLTAMQGRMRILCNFATTGHALFYSAHPSCPSSLWNAKSIENDKIGGYDLLYAARGSIFQWLPRCLPHTTIRYPDPCPKRPGKDYEVSPKILPQWGCVPTFTKSSIHLDASAVYLHMHSHSDDGFNSA